MFFCVVLMIKPYEGNEIFQFVCVFEGQSGSVVFSVWETKFRPPGCRQTKPPSAGADGGGDQRAIFEEIARRSSRGSQRDLPGGSDLVRERRAEKKAAGVE